MTPIPGYEIQHTLYESRRTLVYRAIRAHASSRVILKILNLPYPGPEDVAAFKREFSLTRKLDIDGVATAYGLEQHEQTLLMCLEDFGGASLASILPSRPLTLEEFLALAVQVTNTLGDIHHHHVLHKDINPSNIIWNPETHQVKIVDFGIASEVSADHPALLNPAMLEGTVAYMAPEQTGRMNRDLDYRADFYALGVTLYEMLLGVLPFPMTDTMELIHAHLAKMPRPPCEVRPDVPGPVSQIIMKLLAKNAEDRYQTTHGLLSDLQKCAEQLRFSGQIQFVDVGQDDVSDRFRLPQKLYGRAGQYHTLLQAFERISKGARELVLISGYAGMGKSALAHELLKPVVATRGHVLSVQFDRIKRDAPYLPLIQALQAFVRQLLNESGDCIAAWKDRILAAIGEQGHVLTVLIPALHRLIGDQPPVPDLSPEESQNRLHLLLRDFLQAVLADDHPFVIVLDDVEWADAASLKLLLFSMTAPDIARVLVIGTSQNAPQEMDESVRRVLDEARQADIPVSEIPLAPLSVDDLTRLLADAFACPAEEMAALAKIVFEKTYGTPLAVREFLKALYREEVVRFDTRTGRWEWDPEQIQGMALTDNVVRFMTDRIQQLPERTQALLRFAACIGTRFDLHVLAHSRQVPEREVIADLEPALLEGLVVPADDGGQYAHYLKPEELADFALKVRYDFVHSRIREAAEAMMDTDTRARYHLSIGRHLLQCDLHKETRADSISDIVNHLNQGTHLLQTNAERVKLAKLNLLVGKRAKALAAYPQALQYFSAGIALLKKKSWQEHYALSFQLYREWTEVESLCGNFDQAEHLISLILNQVNAAHETAEVLVLQVRLYTMKGQHADAIRAGCEALRLLGTPMPRGDEMRLALQDEVAEIRTLLKTKPLATLLHEPELTLPEAKIIIRLLDHLITATLQTDRPLYYVVVAKIVNMALKYGHTSDAAYGFAQYGVLLGALWGYYKAGYEFGKFAVRLSEKYNNPSQKCKALCAMAGQLIPWVRHMQHTASVEHDAYQIGLYAGELQFAGFAVLYKVMNWFSAGVNVRRILAGLPKFLKFAARVKHVPVVDGLTGYRLAIQNVCGLTAGALSFDTDELQERHFLEACRKHGSFLAFCLYSIVKTQILLCYQAPAKALRCAQQAEPYIDRIQNMVAQADYVFYTSLCLTALIPDAEPDEQRQYWQRFRANRGKMEEWAEHCPDNFQAKLAVLQAEEARLNQDDFAAMTLYRQAEQLAKTHQFLHLKALVHELAARFYLERDFEDFARLHVMKAHGNYTMWGATRKVEQLNETYTRFFSASSSEIPRPGDTVGAGGKASTEMPLPTTEQGVSLLDLQTVMKASQTFSGEIVLPELLKRMMRIVLENAGAQTGWLLLEHQGAWTIEAEGRVETEDVTVLQSIPVKPDDSACESPIPWAVVQYVIRTGEPLVLNDASREGNFTGDTCILRRKTRSVLCSPLMKQGKLTGILYLENNLSPGAFTADRLEVLKMLSAQMAISIENATLYKHLQEALEQQIALSNEQVELTTAYSRFVPGEFISLLGKQSITDVQLGDQVEEEITVMFSDIRGFTPLSEHMTPQQNFNFINSYLSQMSPIIRNYQGFIDKYIGDAIMALFPTNADDAVQASIAMLRQLVRYNQGRRRAGYQEIKIGIGLNTGELMLGTVGDQARMDGTVISDAVNLASRVEGMTKVYGVSLLISETTYFQLQDPAKYAIRIVDQVQAKGKSEPVTVFEVFDGDPPQEIEMKQQTLMLFKQGFKLYHQAKFAGATSLFSDVLQVNPEGQAKQIAEAKEFFQEILHVNPDDKVARIYVQRCENIQQYGMADEWKGVWAWIESLRSRSL